ncbi:MAG: DHA2 family efflux MFS transporter permease subunit [Sphingomonadales bacterium]|nr:DHA2 family efflux MFS transporter permease subunit [Sphingomonadales bacterium]MDE2171055.1 DHA2 family efflux MFS transporter permease subunit [Sphingomonadales bacterium]
MNWLRQLGQDWAHDPQGMPSARKYLILAVMAFGQFMALFDIQIVSASLRDVQAGLAAGPDEVSWVQTAYLMAELVMIPLSGYLANAMSTRWAFTFSAASFTFFSLMCGLSWNLASMIAFRAAQGFTGGTMVSLVFATAYTMFTGKQRAVIPAILGAVSVLAPTLGPSAGGLITDLIDWRWLFFVNVVPGVMVALLASQVVRVDRPNPAMFARIDWSHLAAMAVFLAGLEYVLEEGPRHDWFGDQTIAIAGWCSFVGFVLFLERSFFSTNPLVKLSPFRRPTFAFACIFNLVLGVGMYSAVYLVPVYLGQVRGYDSLQIGTTVIVVGLAQMMSVVVATWLSQRIDMRYMITAGLSCFALSLWLSSDMNSSWGFWELAPSQALRGFAMMLCIVPSVTMALAGFQPAELKYASGLFNLMRNLGGAIGIAVVNTLLQNHVRMDSLWLGEAMAHGAAPVNDTIAAMAGRMSAIDPDPRQALLTVQGLFARVAGREALTLAFNDVFRLLAWMFIAALVMVPFCRPPAGAAPSSPEGAH